MENKIFSSLSIFPAKDMKKTAEYYEKVLGFKSVEYLSSSQPHICLYRDDVEIVLISSNAKNILINRDYYGYDCEDGYFISKELDYLLEEFKNKGAKIVKDLEVTDYNNREFIVEDIDGRWLAFGIKIKI